MELKGKVALVTGGSRGIGLAAVVAFLERGANVVMTGRTSEHFAAARETVNARRGAAPGQQPWGELEAVAADVREYRQAAEAVEAAAQRFGGLDILVNNAGVGIFADVAAMSLEQWSEIIDTNLTGVFHCCHAAIPHL